MKKIINPQMGLFATGVLQPASAQEVRGFLGTIFKDAGELPPDQDFRSFLEGQLLLRRVIKVSPGENDLYSLTLSGNHYLSPALRKSRDKYRMYLLRDAHRARIVMSRGEADAGLAGASPAADTSTGVKGSAANKVGLTAFGRRFAHGQPYWPRISWQFVDKTGLTRPPRDNFPLLLSFNSTDQFAEAAQLTPANAVFDYVGLGLCLGVSPQLIWQIARNPNRHYRTFMLPKKGGGERRIESPRVFLKVVQWFLSDFVLDDLVAHESVHSFAIGRSIVSNAQQHVGRAFVGSVDIEDFFGSITAEATVRHFQNHGFRSSEANLLSSLCTKENRLPQGAPTSPVISNSILYGLDARMSQICDELSLRYTRYADDITISGESRPGIADAMERVEVLLRGEYALRLNRDKTRIASKGGQQRVTGVVVNVEAAPPRAFRRRVRAGFHNASVDREDSVARIRELDGYVGYLKSFPKLAAAREVVQYERVLRALRSLKLLKNKRRPRPRT